MLKKLYFINLSKALNKQRAIDTNVVNESLNKIGKIGRSKIEINLKRAI